MKLQSLILKLHATDCQINQIQEQIEVVENLTYYENFNKESEKIFDIAELKLKLKDLFSVKNAILDSFSIAINLEKSDLSYLQRELNLSDYEISKIN